MMGRNHVKQGACACAIVGSAAYAFGWFGYDPPMVAPAWGLSPPLATAVALVFLVAVPAISVGLVLGGSVAPDGDSKGSTVTRSYGPISKAISFGVRLVVRAIYSLTRTSRDKDKTGAHRLFTHTAIGNASFGAVLAGVCSIDTGYGPLPAAVALGGVVGLGAYAFDKKWRWNAALVTGVVAYYLPGVDSTWLWLWGVAFALGCAVHCFGDSCTYSGTPWTWPVARNGRRWSASHVLPGPLRVRTGKVGESLAMFITFALTAGIVAIFLFVV